MKKIILFLLFLYTSVCFAFFDKEAFFEEIQKSNPSQEMIEAIDSLKSQFYFKLEAEDEKARPLFVFFQAEVEKILTRYLEEGKIRNLIGVIHTKAPATPLCTLGKISEGLVAPQMETDPLRLATVTTRADIIRKYLEKGGRLYAAFTKDGFYMRTKQQQEIFQNTLQLYSGRLFSYELSCSDIPIRMNGATYIFESGEHCGLRYFFNIMAPQALFSENDQKWALWFGNCAIRTINERYYEIASFLFENGGPIIGDFFSGPLLLKPRKYRGRDSVSGRNRGFHQNRGFRRGRFFDPN